MAEGKTITGELEKIANSLVKAAGTSVSATFQVAAAAGPYEDQREYRKQITHANLIGGNRNEDHIKNDASQQNGLAPALNQSRCGIDRREHDEDQCRDRCLEGECGEEVVPPAARLQLSEEIERIILKVIRIDQGRVPKIHERRLRKEIGRFDHKQGTRSHDQEPFQGGSSIPAETQGGDEHGQECAREFARHCGSECESGEDVAAFPEKIKGQNSEDGQWHVRRHQHSVREQVRRERVQSRSEQSSGWSKHIASPEKRYDQANRGECGYRGPAPEEQSIRIVFVQEVETELVFVGRLPIVARAIKFGMNEQQGKRCNQFRERRMFRIHSKIARLPVAISGCEMNRFISRRRQLWDRQ